MSAATAETLQETQHKKYQPAETRARILAAAQELFREQGYPKTSASEVARKAGVAEGSIFYHFGSKRKLLTALGAQFANEKVEVMRGGETDLSKLEPGLLIARIFAHVERNGMLTLMMRLPPDGPEVNAFNAVSRERVVSFIAECMAASCAEQSSDEDLYIRASLSYSVVADALMHLYAEGEGANKAKVLAETIRFVRSACGYGHLTEIPQVD